MSYTNGTPFLNLPQTIGSDHRDWFDTNEPFLDLDTKVKTLWDDSGSAASAIDALQELTATLQTDLTSLEGTVDTHTSALSTINEALVLINGTLSTLNTSVATKFDSAGIADPYDATHGTYGVGAVVTYNGQRYVCNTAVTAAEPFDADKWTAEDIQSVLGKVEGRSVIYEQRRHSFGFENPTDLADALHQTAVHILNYIQGLADGVNVEILNMKFIGAGNIIMVADAPTLYNNTATDFSIHCFTNNTSGSTMYLYDMICWANTASANRISRVGISDNTSPTFKNLTLADLSGLTGFNFDIRVTNKV